MTAVGDTWRVILCQPALPAYRLDFFGRLADHFGDKFRVYYSPTDMGALTDQKKSPQWSTPVGAMRPLVAGVIEWQPGVLDIPLGKGDVLILSGGPRTVSTLLLMAKARLKGVKTVWFSHYWSGTSKKHRFYLRMLLAKFADSMLFYTDAEIAEYREGLGKDDKRPISAINNGMAIEPIAKFRQPFDARARPKSILFVGRLTDKCDLELLVRALASDNLQDVRLEVVGDGPARARYVELAEHLGVSGRISWHGGTTDEERIAAVANRCRIFVYPGAVGLSVIHALGYGIPAIINNDRWTNYPEAAAVCDGRNGRLFEKGDVESLTDVIFSTINSEDTLDAMSKAATGVVDTIYNTREMARRVVELVTSLHEDAVKS